MPDSDRERSRSRSRSPDRSGDNAPAQSNHEMKDDNHGGGGGQDGREANGDEVKLYVGNLDYGT